MQSHVALIDAGIVATIIVGTKEFADTLGYDAAVVVAEGVQVGQGWAWDGAHFVPPPTEVVREVAPADFMRRFAMAEWIAAHDLAKTDSVMAYAFELLRLVAVVHLDHADTLNFVGYMASKGILSPARAEEILTR